MGRPNLRPAVLALYVVLSMGPLIACSDSGNRGTENDPPPGPNVVLLLADDMGWTGTSVRIHPSVPESRSDFYQTPTLEQLAAEGMVFSSAYSPHPVCSPARAGIQTGKNPAALHMTNNTNVHDDVGEHRRLISPSHVRDLPSDEVTIARFIKTHRPDYRTAHFGKWHLGGGGPGPHGYDTHDGETGNKNGQSGDNDDPRRTFEITRRAMDFMAGQVEADKPFFVQVSYYALHRPLAARAETVARYKRATPGRRHYNVQYAAMTEELDTAVGMMLQEIQQLGIADHTYVIFTSDNGATLEVDGIRASDNTPLAGQKSELLEGGIRVPLFIRGPGIAAGSASDVPVLGQDLFPTIAEWLGIGAEPPCGVEGGSLAALLKGDEQGAVSRPGEGLVWHIPHYNRRGAEPQSALRMGRYKLIHTYEDDRVRLFDLVDDISETSDVSRSKPNVTKDLEGRLSAYLRDSRAQLPVHNPDS